MRARWKIIAAFMVAGALLFVFLSFLPGVGARSSVEEARRELRQQGFKIDLAEFDFSIPEEWRARSSALTNALSVNRGPNSGDYLRQSMVQQAMADLNLLSGVGSNSALVTINQDRLVSRTPEIDLWPLLREAIRDNRAVLDSAQEAALAGPIRFNLNAQAGNAMLLPHLAALKSLAQRLGARALLELHYGNAAAAWTNLLAANRLATQWDPEPAEISHLVRFASATIAFNTVWQALQFHGWTDDQLAALQREWESANFFKGLPETAAFMRASMAATCRLERQQPVSRPAVTLDDTIRSPQSVWYALSGYWRQLSYRRVGSYEDEKALLFYYRDRELDVRRAVQCSNWVEMRGFPGITNAVHFQSKHPSQMQSLFNMKQIMLASMMYAEGTGGGQGFLGRAAEVEARRRIIVSAVALERHRVRHGAYPDTLMALVPDLLKESPVDFMDGKPLRYRRTDDGHFVLYSVGLDGVDNGGTLSRKGPRQLRRGEAPVPIANRAADLVWPRPASAAEVDRHRREQLKAEAEITDHNADLAAEEEWQLSARRQAGAGESLAADFSGNYSERRYQNRALSEVLRNEETTGTNKPSLKELLTLKVVATAEGPETLVFETRIRYEVLTNLGSLHLLVDHNPRDESDEGSAAGLVELRRATNGNCLLVWRTIYEAPGRHALQMGLELNEADDESDPILGPVAPFTVTNLCQFSVTSATFDPRLGATLRAKLPESNGTYTVTILSPTGERLKTISGGATNGSIKLNWDLKDEQGRRCTNAFFDTLFQITLPDLGRSQTLKGP